MTCFFMADIESREGLAMSCTLADALAVCGVHCVVVTPEGMAPRGLRSSVAFAAEELVLSQMSATDTVVFSAPRDVERMARLPARLAFLSQGTAASLDSVSDTPSITVLTCWPATAASIRERTRRDPIEVGVAVDDVFFQTGLRRVAGTLAFVPHSSAGRTGRCAAMRHLSMVPVDAIDDRRAAAILQASDFYLATDGDGGCDLSVLEALAAGCVVVATPRAGRALHLLDGVTGIVAAEHEVCDVLRDWTMPAARIRRAAVRDRGRALAASYRVAALRRRVAALLDGPLAFMRP